MTRHTVKLHGYRLSVDYTPAEPSEGPYPGCAAEVQIVSLRNEDGSRLRVSEILELAMSGLQTALQAEIIEECESAIDAEVIAALVARHGRD